MEHMKMKRMTQEEVVLYKLMRDGEIDNFWAFRNYVLRLGAIIFVLRAKGYSIETKTGKQRGFDRPLHKNTYYILDKTHSVIV